MADTMEKCWKIREEIKKKEQELLRAVRNASCSPDREGLIQRLQELDRAVDRERIVLVDGLPGFVKKSLIHALVGEEVLPDGLFSSEPIYELHYGKEKRVTAYPRINLQKADNTPISVTPTVEGIRKFISTIDGQSDDLLCPFSKIMIHWPLDLLKCGMVFVEIPGTVLLDPYNFDDIGKKYIPVTDFVLYVVNAVKLYQQSDINELCDWNSFGFKNIITVVTDCEYLPEFKSEQEKTRYEHQINQTAMKYSALGKDAVHYVRASDEIDIICGKMSRVPTGIPELRSYLNRMSARMYIIPHLNYCMKTLMECADIMIKDSVLKEYIEPDVLRQILTIRMELPLPTEGVIR